MRQYTQFEREAIAAKRDVKNAMQDLVFVQLETIAAWSRENPREIPTGAEKHLYDLSAALQDAVIEYGAAVMELREFEEQLGWEEAAK